MNKTTSTNLDDLDFAILTCNGSRIGGRHSSIAYRQLTIANALTPVGFAALAHARCAFIGSVHLSKIGPILDNDRHFQRTLR